MSESRKPVATKTFTTELIQEGSWGERDLGKHESTMELYEGDDAGHDWIDWECEALDMTENIGLWYEMVDGKRTLTDYDGVFSLPGEAIELLEGHGIVVPDEFKV
jgi:hypothetical protein